MYKNIPKPTFTCLLCKNLLCTLLKSHYLLNGHRSMRCLNQFEALSNKKGLHSSVLTALLESFCPMLVHFLYAKVNLKYYSSASDQKDLLFFFLIKIRSKHTWKTNFLFKKNKHILILALYNW